jgi:hypothetical protein
MTIGVRLIATAQFVDTGWTLVEGEVGHAAVRQALGSGLRVARLEDSSGQLLGFLLAEDVETPSELRYFQLRTGRSGGSTPAYEVVNPDFPNPSENLPY